MSSEQIWILVSAFFDKWPVDLADLKELHGLYELLYIFCLLNARKQSFRSYPNESHSTCSLLQVSPEQVLDKMIQFSNLCTVTRQVHQTFLEISLLSSQNPRQISCLYNPALKNHTEYLWFPSSNILLTWVTGKDRKNTYVKNRDITQ